MIDHSVRINTGEVITTDVQQLNRWTEQFDEVQNCLPL